ncbi:MAG: hypothetical protein GXP63_00080 [DPANN group archaeon]|nr:hypothetical protein [DPANN group archaeon]
MLRKMTLLLVLALLLLPFAVAQDGGGVVPEDINSWKPDKVLLDFTTYYEKNPTAAMEQAMAYEGTPHGYEDSVEFLLGKYENKVDDFFKDDYTTVSDKTKFKDLADAYFQKDGKIDENRDAAGEYFSSLSPAVVQVNYGNLVYEKKDDDIYLINTVGATTTKLKLANLRDQDIVSSTPDGGFKIDGYNVKGMETIEVKTHTSPKDISLTVNDLLELDLSGMDKTSTLSYSNNQYTLPKGVQLNQKGEYVVEVTSGPVVYEGGGSEGRFLGSASNPTLKVTDADRSTKVTLWKGSEVTVSKKDDTLTLKGENNADFYRDETFTIHRGDMPDETHTVSQLITGSQVSLKIDKQGFMQSVNLLKKGYFYAYEPEVGKNPELEVKIQSRPDDDASTLILFNNKEHFFKKTENGLEINDKMKTSFDTVFIDYYPGATTISFSGKVGDITVDNLHVSSEDDVNLGHITSKDHAVVLQPDKRLQMRLPGTQVATISFGKLDVPVLVGADDKSYKYLIDKKNLHQEEDKVIGSFILNNQDGTTKFSGTTDTKVSDALMLITDNQDTENPKEYTVDLKGTVTLSKIVTKNEKLQKKDKQSNDESTNNANGGGGSQNNNDGQNSEGDKKIVLNDKEKIYKLT